MQPKRQSQAFSTSLPGHSRHSRFRTTDAVSYLIAPPTFFTTPINTGRQRRGEIVIIGHKETNLWFLILIPPNLCITHTIILRNRELGFRISSDYVIALKFSYIRNYAEFCCVQFNTKSQRFAPFNSRKESWKLDQLGLRICERWTWTMAAASAFSSA